MPDATDLVLVTGGTGHIGFCVLRHALEHGYAVRAAIRSEAKAKAVKDTVQSLNISGHLEFVVVPDFAVPNAFDKAVSGVKYIIHVASPLPTTGSDDDDLQERLVKPAIQGTVGLFESAKRAGMVERIVLTSSIAANHPNSAWFEPTDTVYKPEDRLDRIQPPYPDRIAAYCASKIAALSHAEAFIKEQNPGFDAIYIMPSFVLGRDDLCHSTARFMEGTNMLVVAQALGVDYPQAPTRGNNFVSVDDVARVHVLSLDKSRVVGNQSFIVSNSGDDGMEWNDTNEIVKRRFPKQVEKGIFPANGHSNSAIVKLNASKTEKVFGFKHASFEECVVGVCGHYLELLEKEKK
ncbi:hypothetical protein PRZ48_010600 [Zasmidium cellare]|uniref:NAD-dependent epimerase/dehydratase domain-containing protein n=1 Tax=Zasmidium cellare TaxID=395010 RepID=A0ABR0E954_ZASCE|nr:hypothetical protein PRZ48_010600 [Zasmidium cellare]